MLYRLQRKERNAVSSTYGELPLYLLVKAPCAVYESNSAGFKISAEELLLECFLILDEIKENPQSACIKYQALWNELLNNYTDLGKECALQDIKTAVCEVMMVVAICMGFLSNSLYNKLNLLIMEQIATHYPDYTPMLESFTSNLYRLGEDKLKVFIEEYMDSSQFISDEITDLVETTRQGTDSPNQLTITQCIFFFAGLFNLSLDSDYTTQSRLAELIANITPHQAESVRTRISELQKLHKKNNFTKQIYKDIENVAKILETYNKQAANELYKEYME